MGVGQKIIPKAINIDLYPGLMPPEAARFIKGLVYELGDTSTATNSQNSATGAFKPIQSVVRYIDDLVLPDAPEDNFSIGHLDVKETREVYVFVHNRNENHTIYRINGNSGTYDIVYQGSELRFSLNPEHFIHEGGAYLKIIYVTDPETGEKKRRTFLFFVLGNDHLRFICVEDSIDTQSFDSTIFSYFQGDYDKFILTSASVPTPTGCIEIEEIPLIDTTVVKNNNLLFNTWQFRLMYVDVWGRPSEHGQISDMYFPGGGDCISQSSNLPRCINLLFDAPPPHIDKIQVEYRRCNETQWYIDETLELFIGSNLGEWWLRQRNPAINYNDGNNTISHEFCAEGRCQPVSPTETNRLYNPIPDPQSVSPIGKFIGVGNNKDGFLPFSKELRDKISFIVDAPEQITTSTNTFRNIELLIEVYNPFTNKNGKIYFYQDKYWFGGGSIEDLSTVFDLAKAGAAVPYNQFFANDEQQGFGVYLEGVNAYTITEQYSLDSSGTLEKVTDFNKFDPDKKYFQRAVFNNVPRGRYVARVFSNAVDPSELSIDDLKKTSTYVSGTYSSNFLNPSSPINHDVLVSNAKEIIIDVCENDYSSLSDNKALIVWDFGANSSALTVEQGYVYNTNNADESQYGIELLKLSSGAASKNSVFTDHNGYYFVASPTNRFRFQIFGYCGCNQIELVDGRAGTTNQQWTDDFFLNDITSCPDYESQDCNHILVKGKIVLCNSSVGVPGISVTLSRGKTAITDNNGEFTIIAHDDVLNPQRNDTLYFNTTGCPYTDCEGNCIGTKSVIIPKCISCEERIIIVDNLEVSFITARGLLSGGVYSKGVVGWDEMDRPTFVQPLGNLSIPSVYETKIFQPSTLSVIIDKTAVFPSKIKYLTFWLSEETTIEKYITWIVDRFEFIDNTGVENALAPTQIKIYYASLIEYNQQNNFNTTVSWSFISESTNMPVTADKVQFLLNGDGTFFEKNITALIKYDQEGQYFLINYTDDLKDLKENAIIRLIRPRVCDTQQPYFEFCNRIDIQNGTATINAISLNAFDTYYLSRQIPVPVQIGEDESIQNRIIGVPFEHNSPSDFWGAGCKNIGRVNVDNPYETELYHQDQVALSGALSENGQLNFLCYFDSTKKYSFYETGINGIVSLLFYPGILLVIGQSNNFLVGFDDNLLRINQDGTAQAGSIANSFGQPQIKISGNYGCLMFDKMTISRYENLIQWLDSSKSTIVQHNYKTAVQVTRTDVTLGIPGGVDSWIRPKIKAVQQYNQLNDNTRYFHGIINPVNMEYFISDFIISSKVFINNERDYNIDVPETLSFNTETKLWKGAHPFTPQMFAQLQGEKSAQQLFSFVNAIPYKHYSNTNVGYGTVYGEKVNRVFEVVAVIEGMNKKRLNAVSLYCKQSQYFCDRALTENGQQTRMLLSAWLQAEYGWHTSFLCDLNTPSDPNRAKQTGELVIFEGNVMYGNYIIIRLIGDPDTDDQYSELEGIICYATPNSIQ